MTDNRSAGGSCNGLLLAAGFSRRFGADKRLQELPDDASTSSTGRTIALATIENWLAACKPASNPAANDSVLDHLYVVTRPNDALAQRLQRWLAERQASGAVKNCTLLEAPNADLGMGNTLASAVTQIPASALVIGLADMPYVSSATLRLIAGTLRTQPEDAIVQPVWDEAPGNPLGFGAKQRSALAGCAGDQGARQLVKAAGALGKLHKLNVRDPGIVRDIDVPADLHPDRLE